MINELPKLFTRDADHEHLITRNEAAELLGYSVTSMATVMGRAPERWPRPAALLRRGRVWVMLWDREEMIAAAPRADATVRRGGPATISDSDGLLTCLECGRRFRSLGRHINHDHGLTAAEYRAAHQLPATGALTADGARAAHGELMRELMAEDPDMLSHLEPYQSSKRLDVMRADAVESARATRAFDAVAAARLPGQRYGTQSMQATKRAQLDASAQHAGFESMADAIEQTRGLSQRKAAARIGVGSSTVARWRVKLHPRNS